MFTCSTSTKDFLGKSGPVNYVAGIGRGASGFTTQSDIGPALNTPVDPLAFSEGQILNDENEAGLFAGLSNDADDLEADAIYSAVDANIGERRKARREAKEKEQLEKYRELHPKIQEQFIDLKRNMATVSAEEWASIPEVTDMRSIKKKKKDTPKERFTPVPDSVLLSARGTTEYAAQLNQVNGLDTPLDSGTQTNLIASGITDFQTISDVRNRQLGRKLDSISSGTTTSQLDAAGYITALDSSTKPIAGINDLQRTIVLLKSLVKTNGNRASSWLSLVRVEREAGKLSDARKHVVEGCEKCPVSEELWLEALACFPENKEALLIKATNLLPNSVSLWTMLADLTNNPIAAAGVLERALETCSGSAVLWKKLISILEKSSVDEKDRLRETLVRAVQNVPQNKDLWIALAKIETHENSRRVLNKARKACPTSHEIWIVAARLEEIHSGEAASGLISTLLQRGIRTLDTHGVHIARSIWLDAARQAELDGLMGTCAALVNLSLELPEIAEADREATWLEDAEICDKLGYPKTARLIYSRALAILPNNISIWRAAVDFENNQNNQEEAVALLRRAVQALPEESVLWLMLAKTVWKGFQDINGARAVLEAAFVHHSNNESVWLAAVKLESETGELNRARILLDRARSIPQLGPKVWLKAALFERQYAKDGPATLALLQEAIKNWPKCPKFYMMAGQLYEDPHKLNINLNLGIQPDVSQSRRYYAAGCRQNPLNIPLWCLSVQLELSVGAIVYARATAENAQKHLPKEPEILRLAVLIEKQAGNLIVAKARSFKALQVCPKSGRLWLDALSLESANRFALKTKLTEAIRKCPEDPWLFQYLGRMYWADRCLDKARVFFEKSLSLYADLGDTWAYYYAAEIALINSDLDSPVPEISKSISDSNRPEAISPSIGINPGASIISRCVSAHPRHGPLWTSVSKNWSTYEYPVSEILLLAASKITHPLD